MSNSDSLSTEALLTAESPFVGYAYSYPHKSAYRRLDPPLPLDAAWAAEDRSALFLYLHVPFCEYRCGFCNLFTLANAEKGWTATYLRQMRAEAHIAQQVLGDAHFARLAIGGGTPTFLNEHELADLLETASLLLGGGAARIPASCEASPATLTTPKARLLRERGVERISLGVQSFNDSESRALGRPQRVADVQRGIEIVRALGFPVLNIDLIYGAMSQSLASWLTTVSAAVECRPEEIYLYPLYVRELTGLGKTAAKASDDRVPHYREARDLLLAAGYEQSSLRMFRLPSAAETGPVYCCQSDGMLGIGCGARSYTRALHYSTEFAVGRGGVYSILAEYLQRDPQEFRLAHYGYLLSSDEQRRRFVIQGLLQAEGLGTAEYQRRFGDDVLTDLPQLRGLANGELATFERDRIRLTARGLERSDAIGPWLYSERVRAQMEEFECV